ncbi:MAG: redoxin domain-containing protein [Nitrospirae bacterium]|nr:redoxin domain-containing protein [Nitrospirota bacterium]
MTMFLRGIAGIVLGMLLIYSVDAQAVIGRKAPEIISPAWINSEPQSLSDLRGKVVMVEFWTFGCYNCRNVEPQIKKWHRTYADRGLVVIGIHTPEFSYEKEVDAVKKYVQEKMIPYAVAIDNDFTIWNQYQNHYWPAIYLIDKQGVIRYIRAGEGNYAETEKMIQNLLAETQ